MHRKNSATVFLLTMNAQYAVPCAFIRVVLDFTSIFFPRLQMKSYPRLLFGIVLTSLNTFRKTLSLRRVLRGMRGNPCSLTWFYRHALRGIVHYASVSRRDALHCIAFFAQLSPFDCLRGIAYCSTVCTTHSLRSRVYHIQCIRSFQLLQQYHSKFFLVPRFWDVQLCAVCSFCGIRVCVFDFISIDIECVHLCTSVLCNARTRIRNYPNIMYSFKYCVAHCLSYGRTKRSL